jgi:NAD(P)-dependent dehydrogenase (short-subunit alcohol dehydrogenase family)
VSDVPTAATTSNQTDDRRPGVGAVALVTGANGGIGLEISRQLLAAGLTVYVGARDVGRGRAAVDELGEGARLVELDVTDAASVAAAAANIDRLDVLVNNAGVGADQERAPQADVASFRRTYETNVFGVLAVTNAFLPALRRSAYPRVVNLSSGTGSLTWSSGPNPQFDHRTGGAGAAYRSSKAALNALTVYYAQALDDDGIKVNALAPGLRKTNLNPRAASAGGDPAEAAAGAVRLALLPEDGPTGTFFSWDGSEVPW